MSKIQETKISFLYLYIFFTKTKTIIALPSNDNRAITYMIRGKMMSCFSSVSSTDLRVYFNIYFHPCKQNKSIFSKNFLFIIFVHFLLIFNKLTF